MQSPVGEVLAFLTRLKKPVSRGKVFIIDTDKNLACMALLEMTKQDVIDVLLRLTIRDYVSGPDPDYDKPGTTLWIFGKTIDLEEIYVKLKIVGHDERAVCLSFHPAERPLTYPYK